MIAYRDKLQCTVGGIPGEWDLTCAMGDHAVTLNCLDDEDLREIASCIECLLSALEEP